MADITLGSLLALILKQLDDAVEQTITPGEFFQRYTSQRYTGETADLPPELLNLHLSSLDFKIPAHLQLRSNPLSPSSPRLTVTLPAALRSPPYSRVGRIKVTIAFEHQSPEHQSPSELAQ